MIRLARNNSDSQASREREVLSLISTGAVNDEIATELSISNRTVETHVGRIYGKLAIKSRVQAALLRLSWKGVSADEYPL